MRQRQLQMRSTPAKRGAHILKSQCPAIFTIESHCMLTFENACASACGDNTHRGPTHSHFECATGKVCIIFSLIIFFPLYICRGLTHSHFECATGKVCNFFPSNYFFPYIFAGSLHTRILSVPRARCADFCRAYNFFSLYLYICIYSFPLGLDIRVLTISVLMSHTRAHTHTHTRKHTHTNTHTYIHTYTHRAWTFAC